MKLKDLLFAAPLALALTACAPSASTATGSSGSTETSGGLAGSSVVANAPSATGSTGSSTITGSGSTSTSVNGCPANPTHPIYQYSNLQGVGSGPVLTTANDITADSKLRVSINPGSANGTVGTGATANYTYLSADVHLIANGSEIGTMTIKGNPVTAPNGYEYPIGIPVGYTSNPSIADFSSYLSGNQKYSIRVDNIKTDYKCNQYATYSYYQTQGDCMYYQTQSTSCPYNWNFDYHQWMWACCYTNMLEQAQELQCGVGTPLENATFSMTVYVETDSTPCIAQVVSQ